MSLGVGALSHFLQLKSEDIDYGIFFCYTVFTDYTTQL